MKKLGRKALALSLTVVMGTSMLLSSFITPRKSLFYGNEEEKISESTGGSGKG